MACKTPLVMPDNTAISELIGENSERGYKIKSGTDLNLLHINRADNDIVRPLTDIYDLVDKLYHVEKNREEAKEKAEVAYEWVSQYTWDDIAKEWDSLFKKAFSKL